MSEDGAPGPTNGREDRHRTGTPFGELGLSATDLADAFHLAAVMKRGLDQTPTRYATHTAAPETEPLPEEGHATALGRSPVEHAGAGTATAPPSSDSGIIGPEEGGARPDPPLSEHATGSRDSATLPSTEATFAPSVLGRRQRFLSALGPFNLRTPQGPEDQVDPEGTARNYARALLDSLHWGEDERRAGGVPIIPVTRRRRQRAVRLTVLVDDGVSMLFQRGVAQALIGMLRGSGVFRGVRELRFDSERTGVPLLLDGAGNPAGLSGLWERGPGIVLVLTGGLGQAWRDRGFQAWLAGLGARNAVAVVHLLQPQVWRRGTIRTVPSELRMSWPAVPCAPNSGYLRGRAITDVGEEERDHGTLIPVLPLWPGALHDWASFVMFRSRSRLWVHTVEFPDREHPDEPEDVDRDPMEHDRAEEVRRFQQSVSPEAFDLAVGLAAVPLSPRMVEVVSEEVLGGSSPSELTEVFFSGLVRVVDEEETGEGSSRWEFREGVRRELLRLGGRVSEIRRMLRLTSEHLRDVDPWFEELAHRLVERRAVAPRRADTAHPWVEAVFPALEAISMVEEGVEYADSATSGYVEARGQENHPSRAPEKATVPGRFGLQSQTPGFAREDSVIVAWGADSRSAGTGGSPDKSQIPSSGENMTDSLESSSEPTSRTGRDVVGRRSRSTAWVQVPHRNASFVGREELLSSLRDQLIRDRKQVITALRGMSGVGKTEMAKEYLYRNSDDYDLICWIPSRHINQVRNTFLHIATSMGVGGVGADNEYVVSEVLEALRRGDRFRRWLLVYDNAQSRAELQRFLPVGGEGHVIITSRDGSWELPGGYGSMSIREFDRDESIQLLRRRGPRSLTGDEADRLAEELGDLPLALNQAAVWLHESGMPAAEYLEQFARKKEEMIRLLEPEDPGYQVPVAAAWNVSLDRLAVTNPGALRLLQLCSFLSASPIPKYVFEFARGIDGPPELIEVLEDPTKLNMAIRAIGRNSLAHIDHQQNTISLHRLVQMAVKAPMPESERVALRHCAHQLLGRSGPRGDASEGGSRYGDLLPHVWASEAWDCDDPWMRRVVVTLCRVGLFRGQGEEIIHLCRVAHETWRSILGETHPDTLSMALQLSRAHRALGEMAQAREMCSATLEVMRRELSPEDPEILEAEAENVRNLWSAGSFHNGLTEARNSLERCVRMFGEDDPQTLIMSRTVAFNELLTGFPEQAGARFLDARNRLGIVLGQENIWTLGATNGYAESLMEQGHYHEAERVQAELVELAHRVMDEDDAQLFGLIACWSFMLRRVGRHQEAFEHSLHAWERIAALQGRNSSRGLYAAMVHARSLRTVDQFDEALKLAEEVNEPYARLLGEQHPHVVSANVNRAIILRRLHRPTEAMRLDQAALEALTAMLGNNHPSTLSCQVNLANDHFLLGETGKAREVDERALGLCWNKLGIDHPLSLLAERNLLLSRKGLGEGVATEYEMVRERYRTIMGPEHPSTLTLNAEVRGDADIYLCLV